MTEGLRALPLHDRHARAGARFAPFAGWEMPLQYTGIVQEHEAVRQAAGIFDVTHMGRVEVRGPQAGEQIRSITTADVTRLRPGRSRYSLYCAEDGGIADDVFVYRVEEERWLIVHNASNAEEDAARVREVAGDAMRDIGGETVMFAVQGPEAGAALRSVLGIELQDVPRRGCVEVPFGGATVLFGRTGYTGEDGGECITGAEHGGPLWDAFLEAGVTPTGLGARDTLRLEAALPLHGHEITPATQPYEAGLGFAVHLDDGVAFTGRAALERLAQTPPERQLACLRLLERAVPREQYPVLGADGAPVSVLTSGAYSPTLRTGIGMAYLPVSLATPGTALAVDIRGRAVPAEVTPRPFYRREE
ncbi:MAG: glycine cleavage system aminomethyltransferase GcvT [Dehalococcoidia bacterium]